MKKLNKEFVDKFCDKCSYRKGRPVKLITGKDMYYIDCPHELKDCPNTAKEESPPTVTSGGVSSFIAR